MINESPFFDSESGERYDAITVDKFSFLLPCKAFNIKYTISKGYHLPVTYEFILRFLKIFGPTEIDILKQYFGFSSSELAVELKKLINDGYIGINVHTNKVNLTTQGKELFIEDKPEIIRTENVEDKIFVELISYNFVKAQKSSHINAFIDMKMTQSEAQAASNSKANAKKKFKSGFYQFIEAKDGKESGYRISLRKIDDITALNGFPSEIQANVELRISPTLDLELQLPRLIEFQDQSKILRVIRRAANDVMSIQKSFKKSNLHNFIDLFHNECLVSSYITKDQKFQFSNYIKDVFINKKREYKYPDTESIIGSPLIGQNFQNILNLVQTAKSIEEANEKPNMIWLRPSYPFWGRSKESLENMNTLKRELKDDNSKFMLFTDKKNAGQNGFDAKIRYRYYFDHIIVLDRIPALENIEIIMIPGQFVCSLYYHSIKDNPYRIPFGFISANQGIVEKMKKVLSQYLKGKIVMDVIDNENNFRTEKLEKDILKLLNSE